MKKEKDLLRKEYGPTVVCPIHGEVEHLTYKVGEKVWGKRLCFRCHAEVMNDLVVQKQARFLAHKSEE